jgi:hypothetical protein
MSLAGLRPFLISGCDIKRSRLNDIYIYDVKSGKLVEVPEATTAGKAS